MLICLLCLFSLAGQATDSIAAANQQQAHAVLAAAVRALGGQNWLDIRSSRCLVRIASFYQGQPTGEMTDAIVTSVFPDKQRIETEKGHVVEILSAAGGWEITYKGVRALPPEKLNEQMRRRDHSIETVLRTWFRDPATVLIDRGLSQEERHEVETITLIRPAAKSELGGDAVTLEVDAENHLPVRLSYRWRDPRFHDQNIDAVEFDNYHRVDGIATPFTVTVVHNGQTIQQRYVTQVQYNVSIPDNDFDPQRVATHLK